MDKVLINDRWIQSSRMLWVAFLFVLLLSTVAVVTGCVESEEGQPVIALPELVTVMPTPTLVQGLVTNIPTPTGAGTSSQSDQSPTIPPATVTIEPTATKKPTLTPIPSATIPPEIQLESGWSHLKGENYAEAVREFQSVLLSNQYDAGQERQILFAMGKAALEDGQIDVAADALSQLIAGASGIDATGDSVLETVPDDPSPEDTLVADAFFLLAQVYEERGQCQAAIRAYESYLKLNPDMQAYIQPQIAECHLALGDRSNAVSAFEQAAKGDAYPALKLELNERVAQSYIEEGAYQKAIEAYDQIIGLTENPNILGRAEYQAGWAEILIGNSEAGHDRYIHTVANYPQAFESYLALVDLIEAGLPVDDYDRGLVDFYAGSYEPAVVVLERYIESNPLDSGDARLYLAWTQEKLGDVDSAIQQIDAYIDEHTSAENDQDPDEMSLAANGWIERSKLLARAGRLEDAAASYTTYVGLFPNGDQAPFAAWWSAALEERLGHTDLAAELYEALANDYPQHQDASEALYRAGLVNWQGDDTAEALRLWSRAATEYPEQQFGAAALVWLLKNYPESDIPTTLASDLAGDTYYHLRAQHIVSETIPFQAPEEIDLVLTTFERIVAETWLRESIGLEPGTNVASLSDELLADGRLVRGEKLWRLGLYQEAKRELESLRIDYAQDPIASYQLALFFKDIGLYRSSILAASSILRTLETDIFNAPTYLGKLIYPAYYAELVQEAAAEYGFDPLLQFALIRQESLFESFAQSHAAARGLSQVIPDTGEYIAQRLEWPGYVLEDLYKPHVGVTFGAYYLGLQLDTFGDDVAVALSAYNGGPGSASRWSAAGTRDIDEYLEIVDFGETREYIKRIYAGQAIYRFLYGK